jgi:hypothetical protein
MVYLYGVGGDEKANPGAKPGGAKPRVQNKFKSIGPCFIRTTGLPNVSIYESAVRFFYF